MLYAARRWLSAESGALSNGRRLRKLSGRSRSSCPKASPPSMKLTRVASRTALPMSAASRGRSRRTRTTKPFQSRVPPSRILTPRARIPQDEIPTRACYVKAHGTPEGGSNEPRENTDGPQTRARQINSRHHLAVRRFGGFRKDRSKAGNEGQETRRHHPGGQKAPVVGDEETLGRAHKEGIANDNILYRLAKCDSVKTASRRGLRRC